LRYSQNLRGSELEEASLLYPIMIDHPCCSVSSSHGPWWKMRARKTNTSPAMVFVNAFKNEKIIVVILNT